MARKKRQPRKILRTLHKKGIEEGDKIIGQRIHARRLAMGMSQGTLGEKIGVSFQQVQKYEKGKNRVSGSMLVKIAEALGVPPAYFFDGNGRSDGGTDEVLGLIADRNAVRVLKAMQSIEGTRKRSALVELVEAWAAQE